MENMKKKAVKLDGIINGMYYAVGRTKTALALTEKDAKDMMTEMCDNGEIELEDMVFRSVLMYRIKVSKSEYINIPYSKLKVDHGQLYFDNKITRYYIEDGNTFVLSKCGYIIFNNGDKLRTTKSAGDPFRKAICEATNKYLSEIFRDYKYCIKGGRIVFTSNDMIVMISTVNDIVQSNQHRKEASMRFFPFNKTMDKYTTLYIATFVKEDDTNFVKCDTTIYDCLSTLMDHIKDIENSFSDIKIDSVSYKSLPIDGKVKYCDGI